MTPGGNEDPALGAWSALVSAYQSVLHDLVEVLEREAGIDSGVFSALAYLERAEPPHRLAMAEMQRLMYPRYSQPGFSRLVARMEHDGLVQRRPDPHDGRAAVLVSTRAGRTRYRRADGVYTATIRSRLGGTLTGTQCAALASLLTPIGASPGPRSAGEGSPTPRDLRP